jgi:hypothetical protein
MFSRAAFSNFQGKTKKAEQFRPWSDRDEDLLSS